MASSSASRVVAAAVAAEAGSMRTADGIKLAFTRLSTIPSTVVGTSGEDAPLDGPTLSPLVFINGWTMVKEDWYDLPHLLAACGPREVLIFDNRGVGGSSTPKEAFTLSSMASDVTALMDEVGWESADVFGCSMGGMIAMTLATESPDRVRRLVVGCTHEGGPDVDMAAPEVVSAFVPDPALGARGNVAKMFRVNFSDAWNADQANDVAFEEFVDDSMKHPKHVPGIMAQRSAIDDHLANGIDPSAIRHPTLVVHGDGDVLVPYTNGTRLAATIPNARLATLPGEGHAFWLTCDRRDLATQVAAFLDGHAAL